MVPQPVWHDRPGDPLLTADLSESIPATEPLPEIPFVKNTSGRFWKQPHSATIRTQAGKLKEQASANYKKREEQRKKDDAVKRLEREMKEEKLAEVERKRAITKERKEKAAEKLRLEEMAKRMSAKKLQRMQKRLGRSKKVAH